MRAYVRAAPLARLELRAHPAGHLTLRPRGGGGGLMVKVEAALGAAAAGDMFSEAADGATPRWGAKRRGLGSDVSGWKGCLGEYDEMGAVKIPQELNVEAVVVRGPPIGVEPSTHPSDNC